MHTEVFTIGVLPQFPKVCTKPFPGLLLFLDKMYYSTFTFSISNVLLDLAFIKTLFCVVSCGAGNQT